MTQPEPIRQEIRADYDDKGLKDAARDTKALGDATDKAGDAAEKAARKERTREEKLRDLRSRVTELVREEDRYEKQLLQTGRADERATAASLRRRRQIDRVGHAIREEQRIQERATQALAGHTSALTGLAAAARNVLPALSAGAGILGAYRLIKAELDQIIELQNKAFGSQVTLASAQRSLRLNMAGQPSSEIDRAFGIAEDIATNRGIGQAQSTLALAQAVSSTGGDLDRAGALTDLAAQIRPDQPGELGGISGALGDIGNAIGTQDPNEALGYFLKVAGLSRIAESQRQFKNIPVAIKGLTAEGFTDADAGGLFAAQTIGTGDVTGEMSGTAVISFASQINEFFAEQGRNERGSAALAALRNDPALAKQFIEVLSVERKAAAPLRELLTDRGSQTSLNFENFRGQFGDSSQLTAIAQSQLGELSRGEIEKTAETARRLGSAEESLLNLDTAGGRAGAVRSKIIDVLNASGQTALAEQFNSMSFGVGTAVDNVAVQRAVGMLRKRRQQLLATEKPLYFSSDEFGGGSSFQYGQPNQLQTQRADVLQQLIGELESIGDVPTSPRTTVINNNGTFINQAGDPTRDDLDNGRPSN